MFKTNLKPIALAAMFAATLSAGAGQALASESGIVWKQASSSDSDYCHIKYMAFTEQSLRSGNLEFNPSDIVDMYGSCSFDPTSPEEVRKQIAMSSRGMNGDGGNDSSADSSD
jgi:hypothetical protein